MGISIGWDDPAKTIIRYDFDPFWTWEDLRNAVQQDDALFDSVDHTVHLIFDMRQIEVVPANPLTQLRQVGSQIHPRLGLIVFVGTNAWAKMVLEIFYKVYGSRAEGLAGLESAATLEEARAIIAAYPQRVN